MISGLSPRLHFCASLYDFCPTVALTSFLHPLCVFCMMQVVGKDPEEQLRLMEEQAAEKEKAERLKGRQARNKYARKCLTHR